jgi:hypothetical protein
MGKKVDAQTTVSVTRDEFRKLVQDFTLETSLAEDRTNTAQERKLVELYRDALLAYQVSLENWQPDQKDQWNKPQDLWRIAEIRLQKADGLYFGSLERIRKAEAMEKAASAEIPKRLLEETTVAVTRGDPLHYHCQIACPTSLASNHKMIPLGQAAADFQPCADCCGSFAAWLSILRSGVKSK